MKLFSIISLCFFGMFQTLEASNVSQIAVVDIKNVAKRSVAGQSIDEQLADINNDSKKDLLDLEDSIKQMDSDAKNTSDERKVDDLQVILYDMTKKKRWQIQEAYNKALAQLEKEIHEVIDEISREKGYSLVVVSDIVVFKSFECPDITEETLKRLNKRVQKIQVSMNVKKSKEVDYDR